MEPLHHYPCRLRLNGNERFVAWCSADVDAVLRYSDSRLVVTDTLAQLADVCGGLGVRLEDESPANYDFDKLRSWCESPHCAGVDCNTFLNAWNFLDDLAGFYAGADMPFTRLSREWSGVNETLFWGNNLPAVTPAGRRFDPTWSPEALEAMREVFEAGIRMLETELGERPA